MIINKILKNFTKYILKDELIILNNKIENKNEIINNQSKEIKNLIQKIEIRNKTRKDIRLNLEETKKDLEKIKQKINQEEKENKLEEYWNNIRTPTTLTYPGRPLFLPNGEYKGKIEIDPRIFLTTYFNYKLPKFYGTNDEIAEKARNWVQKKIKYKKDSKEMWQFYFETLERREGDCEDQAILVHAIMIYNNVPYWRIRLNAGNVDGGGHAYLTYLHEKNNKWYILDSTYYPNETKNFGLPWKKAERYYSDSDGKKGFGIWFSCNQKYIFSDFPKEIEKI